MYELSKEQEREFARERLYGERVERIERDIEDAVAEWRRREDRPADTSANPKPS